MSRADECLEVGLGDLTVGLRIGSHIYFWSENAWPEIDGLNREIARAMLTHALARLEPDPLDAITGRMP